MHVRNSFGNGKMYTVGVRISIDCTDYVTGIGNASRAPITTTEIAWYSPRCYSRGVQAVLQCGFIL